METKSAFPSTEVQTVIFGRTDENGRANFIQQVEGDGRNIEVVASSEHPLLIHFANGPDSQLVRWEEPLRLKKSVQAGLLDRRINFLYAECRPDGSLALGITDAAPNYSYKKECFSPETATINMVANETLGHVAQASNQYSNDYPIFKAFNRDFGPYYHSKDGSFSSASNSGALTISYQFAEQTPVRAYAFSPCQGESSPLCWSLFGIDFSGERQLLDERSESILWKTAESRTFVCQNQENRPFWKYQWEFTRVQSCQHLRLHAIELFRPAHCFVIPEMRMYDESGSLQQRVFLGEIDCGIAEVRKVTTYALRGEYQSDRLPVYTSQVGFFNDNLGVPSSLKVITGKLQWTKLGSWTSLDHFRAPGESNTGLQLCAHGRNDSYFHTRSTYLKCFMREKNQSGLRNEEGMKNGNLMVTVKRQF